VTGEFRAEPGVTSEDCWHSSRAACQTRKPVETQMLPPLGSSRQSERAAKQPATCWTYQCNDVYICYQVKILKCNDTKALAVQVLPGWKCSPNQIKSIHSPTYLTSNNGTLVTV